MARRQLRVASALSSLPLVLLLAVGGDASEGDPARGRALAVALCSRCHAVETKGASPLPAAPPFRTLEERYPIESLAEGLAEGLVTGHASMPEVRFEPEAIADFLAFLRGLQAPSGSRR